MNIHVSGQRAINQAGKLASQIDSSTVAEFGLIVQGACTDLNHYLLRHVQKHESHELTKQLQLLKMQVARLSVESRKKSSSIWSRLLFWRRTIPEREALARLHRSEAELDRMAVKLTHLTRVFREDGKMLEELEQLTFESYAEVELYLAALDLRLADLRAEQSGTMLHQAAEERKYELMTSRTILLQTGEQIKMLQRNTQLIDGKIDHALQTIIPLWKQQIADVRTLSRKQTDAAKQFADSLEEIDGMVRELDNVK